jgi:predicted AlkP superfamily phosphohydrolase/phosphomutase
MTKLMVIGIDALDPHLIEQFKSELPNISRLMDGMPKISLDSIIPPDTIPAWVTIYTGMNPAKHGILYAANVFGDSWKSIRSIDNSIFKGKTFWDIAGDRGKKVCILFPQLTVPTWKVSGVMVGRSIDRVFDSEPKGILEKYGINHLSRFKGEHPGPDGLAEFSSKAMELTQEEAQIAIRISMDYDWDLFFVYFGWLDLVEHYFWRYCDSSDPTFPGINPYQDVIRNFYRTFDEIIGKFARTHTESNLIVMSDHGHGMRPPRTVNINELLRKKGYLFTKGGEQREILTIIEEKMKSRLLRFVHKHELDLLMVRFATRAPFISNRSKGYYTSKSTIDEDRSLAILSTFMGPKAYPHGGIQVSRIRLETLGIDYEELRTELIAELKNLRHPESNAPLIMWALRREDVYQGPMIERYPDIVFELAEGFGVHWAIHCPLIGTAYEHNLASGGHKREAVFVLSLSGNRRPARDRMNLMDVAPTLLDVLGVEKIDGFDGTSIFR